MRNNQAHYQKRSITSNRRRERSEKYRVSPQQCFYLTRESEKGPYAVVDEHARRPLSFIHYFLRFTKAPLLPYFWTLVRSTITPLLPYLLDCSIHEIVDERVESVLLASLVHHNKFLRSFSVLISFRRGKCTRTMEEVCCDTSFSVAVILQPIPW